MPGKRIKVWDLPTRIFHGLLAVLVLLQYGTAEWHWLDMDWHFRFGYALLSLLIFRVVWGFFGSETSRFVHFVRSPMRAWSFFRNSMADQEQRSVGHNPLGGWSVLAMLSSLAVQAISGLFASDDIIAYGPLNGRVSTATAEFMTSVHTLNQKILLMLVGLHLLAVLVHLVAKRDNLIAPMIHGNKASSRRPPRIVPSWRALLIIVLAGILVWAVVSWGERVIA